MKSQYMSDSIYQEAHKPLILGAKSKHSLLLVGQTLELLFFCGTMQVEAVVTNLADSQPLTDFHK